MSSFNKVILMGNVTRDVQLRRLQGGSSVAEVGIAMNRTWYDKSANQKREEVTFVDITLFGRTAEVATSFYRRGDRS